MSTSAWVIGARGLLGSATRRAIDRRSDWEIVDLSPLPWRIDLEAFDSAASDHTARFFDEWVSNRSARWSIIWSAGAVVTASPQEQID
jgi:UDP-glucose 4-epimerase